MPRFTRSGQDTDVDLVVIGGGVNGTGVARDATMRGLRVALFERNDLAFGASGNSSGMIHGGPRYLSGDPAVTYKSCKDSGHIQAIAPHLLFRIPFLMPVPSSKKWLFPFLDAFLEAYDRYQPLKRGKPHTRLRGDEVRLLEPGLRPDLYGGLTFDEWGIDGTRLCVANAVDAEEGGARLFVGCTVETIEHDQGAIRAVRYRDANSGQGGRLTTTSVVNATGAWAPLTATLGGISPRHARVRPGKGIHVVFDRRLTNYAIMSETIDGRTIFIEPWQNMSVIGTTDDDYYGDLDDVVATSEEVRYLVEGIARVFPAVRQARIMGTFAGVRPTIHEYGKLEDALSREHAIVDHGATDGVGGLHSMIGGKLASYRLFAEEMVDVLVRDPLGRPGVASTTHQRALPGGDREIDVVGFAREHRIDAVAARRLVYRHGSRAERIGERMKRRPTEARTVCECEPVLEAEIRYVLEHESARSVDGVARRTRLGLGACGGMRCALRCGAIVAEQSESSPHVGIADALRFLTRQARTRVCALGPEQARQEAIAIASLRAQVGIPARSVLAAVGEVKPRTEESSGG